LFVGWCFFVGTSLSFHLEFSLLALCGLILFFPSQRFFAALALVFVAALTASVRVHIPSSPSSHFGSLCGEVLDRRLHTFHGKPVWSVQLAIEDFRTTDGILLRGDSFPVACPSPCPLHGGVVYRFPAHVTVDEQHRVRIHPCFDQGITTVGNRFSLVEWRYSMRRLLEQRCASLFSDYSLRHIAGGLTFGLYKDPLFQKAMHRAGVEHVLAVSGFHFGIVAALTVFLAQGLSPRRRAAVAMVFLTAYLLIIGPLPSVLRAWTSAMVVLLGVFLGRFPSGLNGLGLGLIASVIYDPSSVASVGYQLSYLATAAILLFSQPTLMLLRLFVPSRSPSDALALSRTDQVLLFLLERSLPALSLLIPVFCVLCPYQLAFLQDFSLLGLVYNLLIPALFSLAMPAILMAILLFPLPALPSCFAFLASIPLRIGQILVERAPETSWGMVSGGAMPKWLGTVFLMIIFFAGVLLKARSDEDRSDAWKACL
jgi:competence protein ComEC